MATSKAPIKVQEVSDLDIAFGGRAMELLPAYTDIPEEFRDGRTKWNDLVSTWFFCGIKNAQWKPKDGIDPEKAIRHIRACLGSFEPKHEHKEAGCAYLLSEFFDDVKYERAR